MSSFDSRKDDTFNEVLLSTEEDEDGNHRDEARRPTRFASGSPCRCTGPCKISALEAIASYQPSCARSIGTERAFVILGPSIRYTDDMKRLRLKPREERRLLRGHLWAYRNEFQDIPALAEGELADVYSAEGRFVGRGFFQARGGIAVRILSDHQSSIDPGFLADRVNAAQAYRSRLFPGSSVYRWVFGESDGLPGLVADRYGAVVVCESSCTFYKPHAEALADAFLFHDGVRGVRVSCCGEVVTFGETPATVECAIEGMRFLVNVEEGQKTGLFLDQRLNVLAMRTFAQGARVLDGHCYVGQWSCHAAASGATSVLGVDTSEKAIILAQKHAEMNGVSGTCRFECADISEVLARGETYDLIILDPPALAKSRNQTSKALSLYQSLNRAALRSLSAGGVLITSSCSHFVERDDFFEILKRAAAGAQRQVWVLDIRGASPDHPTLMAMPETAYLKCVTLRAL